MSKFKIGDRVRVLNRGASGSCHVAGDLGTVISANHGIYKVRGDIERDSCRWWVAENHLEFAPKTHTINIPDNKEVSSVENNSDHIRVNLKSKVQVGKWYMRTTTGQWGKCDYDEWAVDTDKAVLEPLGGGKFSAHRSELVEIEPFEEILQVVEGRHPVAGDRWLGGEVYACKRLVLKPEFGG